MKFKLVESINTKENYEGWLEEDIELFESIDWDTCGETDYDAGFAYLDSAVLYGKNGVEYINTEFHKFFKKDPTSLPYYKPIEAKPFDTKETYYGPISKGDIYREYPVYNKFDIKMD